MYHRFLDALNSQDLDAAAAVVDVDRYRENCVGFTPGYVNWGDAQARQHVHSGQLETPPARYAPSVSEKQITVSRTIDVPAERVFALLTEPDRHLELDSSGMLRASRTRTPIAGVGDVFVMDMHNEQRGDYQTENLVTIYVPDREIGWAPAAVGDDRMGHTYTYTLTPEGDGRTRVSQTYDWSAVTVGWVLPLLPRVSREQLAESLDKLAEALGGRHSARPSHRDP